LLGLLGSYFYDPLNDDVLLILQIPPLLIGVIAALMIGIGNRHPMPIWNALKASWGALAIYCFVFFVQSFFAPQTPLIIENDPNSIPNPFDDPEFREFLFSFITFLAGFFLVMLSAVSTMLVIKYIGRSRRYSYHKLGHKYSNTRVLSYPCGILASIFLSLLGGIGPWFIPSESISNAFSFLIPLASAIALGMIGAAIYLGFVGHSHYSKLIWYDRFSDSVWYTLSIMGILSSIAIAIVEGPIFLGVLTCYLSRAL